MKVFKDDAVYVQIYDLGFLFNHGIKMPFSVFEKSFKDSSDISVNKYKFKKFKDDESIRFFSQLDWILDYDNLKNLSKEDLTKLGKKISDSVDEKTTYYSKLTEEEKITNKSVIQECDLLMFQLHTIIDYEMYLKGELEIPFLDELNEESKKSNGITNKIKNFFLQKK